MANRGHTTETLREAFETWERADFNVTKAANAAGLARNTFDNRLKAARMRHPEWFGNAPRGGMGGAPSPAAERTLVEDVQLHRARETAKAATAKYKEAAGRITELEDRLSELELVAKSDARPADWTLQPAKAGEKREHIPMLFTSDFQVGEVIRKEETEHGHDYNIALFRARYRRMIEATIKLSFEHAGRNWTYPGIIYARGGDTISGGIHDELAETDELSPIECVEIAFEEEAAGIKKLVDAFGRVEVKDCGGGNHDRITKKPRSKGAHANYDRLISFMLRREFANDSRIHFQTSESMDVYFSIYEKHVLLTHGDRIGSRGGQGFVGPAATILRGAQKVIMEQAAINRRLDMVMMGHFHTPMDLGWVLVNGSLPGYSEFAKMNRMRPFPPQQWLTYWFEGRGCVDLKRIILTEA